MASRHYFQVEKKAFTVDFTKDQMVVTKQSQMVEVSIAIGVPLARWLIEKLKRLIAGDVKLGFIGSKKVNASNLIKNLRSNRGGRYLSKQWFNSSCSKGFKTICVPQGCNLEGWKSRLSSLQGCLCLNKENRTVMIRRRSGEDKVFACPVRNDRVDEIRNET